MIITDLKQPQRGRWVIRLSFLAGLLLMIIPLPDGFQAWRPDWLLLILIYWCTVVPQRVGIGVAWSLGLLLDILRGSLLGQHALAFSVVVYLAHVMTPRFQVYPLWRQLLVILFLMICYLMTLLAALWFVQQLAPMWLYWAPILTTSLVWPLVLILLGDFRRRFQIS